MRSCSNKDCGETNPQEDDQFYKSGSRCKSCTRAKQRAYRLSPEGRASHLRNRSTKKGLAGKRRRQKRYRENGNHAIVIARWNKYNKVNTDTLREGIPFDLCTNCHENRPEVDIRQECPMMNEAEDIKLCLVWQDWKHTGNHPLSHPSDASWDESPYDPNSDWETEYY